MTTIRFTCMFAKQGVVVVTCARYYAAVRLLHTSDWHLGRNFHGESLMSEQSEAVDRVVEVAADADVDIVVIAGDLYDRAIPPAEAITLFSETLIRLHEVGARVVAITGNHDSATRVSVASQLLELAGVAIRGDVARCSQPLLLDPDDDGPVVAIFPVPYLEPSIAGPVLNGLAKPSSAENGDRPRRLSHHEVTHRATNIVRDHINSKGPFRTVVVAHTFVTGGMTTDSERELTVGNIGHVELSTFEGFDYVALGHLHRSQEWNDGRIAYSGTPLPYSFSEENDSKSVRIVEMDAQGRCHTEVVPLEVGRNLRTLRGTLEELLANVDYADAEQARVRVILTDQDLPLQAMPRLQQRFPHAVELRHDPEGRVAPGGSDVASAVRSGTTPLELALRFWTDQHGADPSDLQVAVLQDALTAASKEHHG